MSTANVGAPIEITLGDGTQVKAANMDEAFRTVAKMKEDTAAALKQQREQNEQLTQRLNAMELEHKAQQDAELARARHQANATGKGLNEQQRNTWLKYLEEGDPVGAANYIDSIRFGIPDPQMVPSAFISLGANVDNLVKENVASAFRYQHLDDYDENKENNVAMEKRMNELTGRGLPYNIDTANLAYIQLQNEGLIKPLQQQTQVQQTPPPSLSGAGSINAGFDADEDAKMAAMTTPELRAYLISKGVKGI